MSFPSLQVIVSRCIHMGMLPAAMSRKAATVAFEGWHGHRFGRIWMRSTRFEHIDPEQRACHPAVEWISRLMDLAAPLE
jgi:hypothetical protein